MKNTLILPGDDINRDASFKKTLLGPGIAKQPKLEKVMPTTAGRLNIKTNKTNTSQLLYLEANETRFKPNINDFVIGMVTGVYGEFYRVSLQEFSPQVHLSLTAFPNASRKNRPNLKVGQVVYARVSQVDAEIDTEIQCIDPVTGKDGGFGLLDESGYVFDIKMNFARDLLFKNDSVYLRKLASRCKFEIAIGMNGKVWIKCGDGLPLVVDENNESAQGIARAKNLRTTLAAVNYLKKCQFISQNEVDKALTESFIGV